MSGRSDIEHADAWATALADAQTLRTHLRSLVDASGTRLLDDTAVEDAVALIVAGRL